VGAFLQRPQSTFARKALFQLHLWTGIAVGLYLTVIGLTGSAVVFRQDLQRAAYPQFFTPPRPVGSNATATMVLAELRRGYPDYRLSGIDWPTYRRDTFLAYVSKGDEFRTVFSHPVSARVAGELPYDRIRWLQDLHFDLLAGRTGRIVNGIGAICLIVMCITGLVIWWPGLPRWREGLTVNVRRGWKRVNWELHGATGFWLLALLLMWAVTGAYFAFPQPFRNAVNAVAPLTVVRTPESNPAGSAGAQPSPAPETFIAAAQFAVPGAQVARIVLPSSGRAPFVVVMARGIHGDADTSDEVTLYFDQYTGATLLTRENIRRSTGDVIMAWIGPLHVGSFGGQGIKWLWALAGLALPLLFVSGAIMWWNRVLNERWARATRRRDVPVALSAMPGRSRPRDATR
jgi:uncharacterized iron-regulated membrane protein